MSNIKSPISFEILQTGDGSPTLSLEGGEKMHSMEGAFSESLYIYADAMERVWNQNPENHILSMGLGLAYNEWIALALSIKLNKPLPPIHSFEIQDFLNQYLQLYLTEKESPLNPCYEEILNRAAQHFKISKVQLFEAGKKARQEKLWQLHPQLPKLNQTGLKFNTILYDAFSSETDDDLWTEEHFENFLNEYCDPRLCYFTTYAATGKLKRSLTKNGFLVEKKAGFGKKRESTLGVKTR